MNDAVREQEKAIEEGRFKSFFEVVDAALQLEGADFVYSAPGIRLLRRRGKEIRMYFDDSLGVGLANEVTNMVEDYIDSKMPKNGYRVFAEYGPYKKN